MNITTPVPHVPTGINEPLLSSGDVGAEDAAKSLESLFASLLLKEMRKTLSDGFFGSDKSDVLGGLFDMHMGQAITEGKGLGIRQMVEAHLARIEPKQ